MNKRKIHGKRILDLVLLVLLALMYRKNAVSMHFHETGGLVLCGLFLIHKALNWKWIRAVTAGILGRKAKRNARWIVDVLLLASMTAVLVTGLLISKTLPTAIAGAHGLQVWHCFFAAVSLALAGIHLGLHGAHLKNNLWKKLPLPKTAGKAIGVVLLDILFCFGSFHLVTSGFAFQFTRPFVSMTLPKVVTILPLRQWNTPRKTAGVWAKVPEKAWGMEWVGEKVVRVWVKGKTDRVMA